MAVIIGRKCQSRPDSSHNSQNKCQTASAVTVTAVKGKHNFLPDTSNFIRVIEILLTALHGQRVAIQICSVNSFNSYHTVPKFWDSRNLCCNLPKIQTKDVKPEGILSKCKKQKWNSKLSSLIWVYTVCPDLSVQKLRVITVGSGSRQNGM